MTLTTTLSDVDADIKIEYVQPKLEPVLGTHADRISRTKIVTESELRSAGINFKTEIDIDEETKQHFSVRNHEGSMGHFEVPDNHHLCLQRKFKCNHCSATFTRNDALIRHIKIHTSSNAYTCDYCSKSYSRINCIRHMKAVHIQKERKSYECHVCGAEYKKFYFLKNHIVLHYEGKTFQCKICSQKFAYQAALTKHVRSKHDNNIQQNKYREEYQCEDCPFVTRNLDHLRSHFRKHHTMEVLQPSSLISCKFCAKTFSNNANYRQHMRTHLKLFKCDACPKAFPNQSKLNAHLAVHSSVDPTCPICDHQVLRGTLKRHMRIHVTEKNFKCQICPRAFSLQINLEKHLLRHVIGNKYQCYMCTFSSKFLANLKFHFTKHIGKKIFKCKVCFKRFLQKDHWSSHVSQHIRGTFSCETCPKQYSYVETLRRHMARHNISFECKVCSKVLHCKAGLNRHIRSIHNSETTEKPYKCEVCSKTFFEKFDMKKHMRNVHRVDKESEMEYRCSVCTYVTHCKDRLKSHSRWHKTDRPHSCAECPKTFKTRACLNKHIKGCHSKEPKTYTCNICFQKFNDRSSRLKHKRVHVVKSTHKCSICSFEAKTEFQLLKVHMNVHTKPFKCDVCLRKFSTQGNLGRHQRTHGLTAGGLADIKIKYECYICGHIARRENSLKIHFSKHTGEKLFKCNVCTKSFARPDYLRLHLRIHTGERPFKCGKCSWRFAQRSSLRGHMKKIHEKQEKLKNPSSEREFECFSCEFSTSDVHNLIKHSRSHGIELNSVVKLNKTF